MIRRFLRGEPTNQNKKEDQPMKRLVSVLLLLCLLLPIVASASGSQVIEHKTIAEAVKAYLDSEKLTYSYDETKKRFSYSMSIDSTLRNTDVIISIRDDERGFSVFAYSPITPKASETQSMMEVAKFITLANYTRYLGNFEMDFSDGEVRYKTAVMCFENIPNQEEIEWLVDIPVLMIQKYGDGLAQIVLLGVDADTAYAPYAD